MAEHVRDIQSVGRQRGGGIAVYIAPGGVGGAVGAVTAHRENTALQPRNARGGGKRQLLIPPAQPCAGQVDDGLAACQKGKRLFRRGMRLQDAGQKASGLPGLTAEPVRQQQGLVAQGAALGRGGSAELPHAAGDAGGHVVQSLGRFLPE